MNATYTMTYGHTEVEGREHVKRLGRVKRVGLFLAAPMIALVYALTFPFVGIGALAYYGVKAAMK